MTVRVGWGFDIHGFGGDRPLVLGGILFPDGPPVAAHSDGDVVAHALADAVLATAGLGDLGTHFPSSDDRWERADSIDLLSRCVAMAAERGVTVLFVDVTLVAESVRLGSRRGEIAKRLAAALGVGEEEVSVKATSTDGLGFLGRDEGIAATAVVTARLDH